MTDGVPMALDVVVLVLLAASGEMLYAAANAERFRGFWQRNYAQTRFYDPSLTPVRFARQAIPAALLVMSVGALFLPAAVFGLDSAPLGLLLAPLVLIVAAGCLLLVVVRTGRPRILVLRPFRDATDEEAERLLRATFVFEFAIGHPPQRAVEAAVLAGDRPEALRRLRSVGVTREELSLWTRPIRTLNVGDPDYFDSTAPKWRQQGERDWIDWNTQPPR